MTDTYKTVRENQNLFGAAFLEAAFESGLSTKLLRVAEIMENMPVTYGQDGLSDKEKTVYLRYSMEKNGVTVAEWFILEKDMTGNKHQQAFGLARIGNNYPELGYINIEHLHKYKGLKIDLDFEPTSLAKIKQKLAA